ncbi:hypothetical protein [Hymenobacter sp. HDW8]|uniref:hypothetical protein n=1 Tax=Hymenobacter sp. HDW8 TaxID=2714932 RepID=UPI0014090261|nr:hypothetical protein [Hymenobacter sp. HDW8]QIL78262.1 hypothetical protein G7064_20770 [Hymenobacter sp. HDW8]
MRSPTPSPVAGPPAGRRPASAHGIGPARSPAEAALCRCQQRAAPPVAGFRLGLGTGSPTDTIRYLIDHLSRRPYGSGLAKPPRRRT